MALIPKLVHMCWLSADERPALVRRCIHSWSEHLAGYEMVLWDTQRFDIRQCEWVRQAFETRKYAFAADYIRLFALYHFGGIYLDADVEVIGSFDDFLGAESFIGYESSGDLEPAVIGARPGTPWIGRALESYSGRSFVRADGSYDMRPLPTVLAPVIEEVCSVRLGQNRREVVQANGVTIFPAEYFSPKDVYSNLVRATPRTRAVHHFDGQWVDRTLTYRAKMHLHRLLIGTVGHEMHRKLVVAARRIRQPFTGFDQ